MACKMWVMDAAQVHNICELAMGIILICPSLRSGIGFAGADAGAAVHHAHERRWRLWDRVEGQVWWLEDI